MQRTGLSIHMRRYQGAWLQYPRGHDSPMFGGSKQQLGILSTQHRLRATRIAYDEATNCRIKFIARWYMLSTTIRLEGAVILNCLDIKLAFTIIGTSSNSARSIRFFTVFSRVSLKRKSHRARFVAIRNLKVDRYYSSSDAQNCQLNKSSHYVRFSATRI